MIKKFAEFINEDFTDLYKRWKGKETRKEDSLELRFNDFISSRKNPEDYYIENGLVCCKNDVSITDDDLINGKLPFKFGKVDGYFHYYYCATLNSIEGSPQEVGKDFWCIKCKKLTSLEGAPEIVRRNVIIKECDTLTSLKGTLNVVMGDFECEECKNLTSLEGAPKTVGGIFSCHDCGKEFTESDIPKIKTKGYSVY